MQAFEEPFPFNLDEFVTVDEVGEEAEEHTPPPSSGHSKLEDDPKYTMTKLVPKRKSSANASSEKFKKQPTLAVPKSKPSADIEAEDQAATDTMEKELVKSEPIKGEKEAEKLEGIAISSDVHQEAKIEKEAALTPKLLESKIKDKEFIATVNSEKDSFNKEPTNKETSHLPGPNQIDSSALAVKQPIPVSELQEQESPAEHQLERSDTDLKKMENKDLLPQDTLVTLDEVGGEGDFADEEELLKLQAGENPEALLTVDEVGGDEAEAEEEQLQNVLQGLVTLDEIVEDEDDAGSFNPEVCIFPVLSLLF